MNNHFAGDKSKFFTKFHLFFKTFCLASFLVFFYAHAANGQIKNGFDLSNASINKDDILSGGPPRDGIPSINEPKFITADKADFLKDDDIIIGLVRGDIARAYPTRILIWHEIVNDMINDEAIAVTYCPLCGTAMVFERRINGKIRSLGVSGLLYQSDVLMYDRESDSLWSQLATEAISGPEVGTKLKWLPSKHLTWKVWKNKYPESEVLSTETGYRRNYGGQAYSSYFSSEKTMFPVPHHRRELPNKEWVVGILQNGQAKAYPVNSLPENKVIKDIVGNREVLISYDAQKRYPKITDSQDEPIPSVMVFWFAWQAFYPETELWEPADIK